MLHKSRDVTSLVLYIPDARMLNAPHDILDDTGDSPSKIWNLGLPNLEKKCLGVLRLLRPLFQNTEI